MSSILLSNPFLTPPPQVQASGADPQTALAITPSQGATGTGTSGNAGSFSGNGSGFGSRDGAQTLINLARRSVAPERPSEATSGSIVNARAIEEGTDPFGTNLPKVVMPDPLPTSPFLKPG